MNAVRMLAASFLALLCLATGPADGSEILLTDFAAIIAAAVGVEPAPAWSASQSEPAAAVFSEQEQREVEERLRGLGYLE